MRSGIVSILVLAMLVLVVFVGCGCGNVYLKGEAAIAAEKSAMDAFQAHSRASTQPASGWTEKAYLAENFKQWRYFVRSNRKDLTWGPKLEGE